MFDFHAALRGAAERGDQTLIVRTIEGLGRVVAERGDLRKSAKLFGGAALLRQAAPWPVAPVDEHWYQAAISSLRDGLGELAFETAWDDGRAMSTADLVRLASRYSAPADGSLPPGSSADG